MAEAEAIVDAEVVEQQAEVAVQSEIAPAGTTLAVTTPVQASDLVERLDKIREAMNNAMQEGVDYGRIPGTDKPTLLKPGAEKLAVLFRLDVQTTHDEKWGPGDHLTVPAYTMIYDAPTGTRLGRGEGMCSTRERKYAYRNQGRACPTCGAEAIIKGKEEYGAGWVCFKKKGGCGAKFSDGAEVIEGQSVGQVDNPDLPDQWNTVIKMGRKRAIVDAVLLVTGASAIFTQDAEDLPKTPASEPVEQGPPYGEAASPEVATSARKAVAWMLDEPVNSLAVTKVLADIENRAGGYLPMIAARAVGHAAAAARDKAETVAPAGDPDGETPEERKEREDAEAIVERVENELDGVQA
jgi:hypothetical protein